MFSVVVVVVLRELIARPLLNLADLLLVLIGVPADFARRRLRPEQLTTKPTVAIVGGGFSGLWAQRALSDDYGRPGHRRAARRPDGTARGRRVDQERAADEEPAADAAVGGRARDALHAGGLGVLPRPREGCAWRLAHAWTP